MKIHPLASIRRRASLVGTIATLAVALGAFAPTAAQAQSSSSCPFWCLWGCSPVSEYPFVFVHGGVGFASSWTEVISDLEDHYAGQCRTIDTHAIDLSFFGDEGALAQELADEVALVMQYFETNKVHLVGHSYGSRPIREFTSAMQGRLYEGEAGDHVASVTLLAGDNAPSSIANTALDIYSVAPSLWDLADDALWAFYDWLASDGKVANTDLPEALVDLSTAGSNAFESRNPNVPGVGYMYHGGRIRNMNTLQAAHLVYAPTWAFLWALGEPNDGLVSVEMAEGVTNPPDDFTLHEGSSYSIGVSHSALIGEGDVWGFDAQDLYVDIVERAIDWE